MLIRASATLFFRSRPLFRAAIRTCKDRSPPSAERGSSPRRWRKPLISGVARFAVHSMKDMPATSPEGLVIAATPPREDPRDAFISAKAATPWSLPEGATLGAASVRRIAQTLNRRPDLKVETLRGNVQTRLEKLKNGVADATYLAAAGLNRLGLDQEATCYLPFDEMLPAVGQGVLCVQARGDDDEALALAAKIHCEKTYLCVSAERAFLNVLDGSCRTPIAGLAVIDNNELWFRGELLSLDGAKRFNTERRIPYDPENISHAEQTCKDAAHDIRARAGDDFLKSFQA